MHSRMADITLRLKKESDGRVRATLGPANGCPEHLAEEVAVKALLQAAAELAQSFESGKRPLADPVSLSNLGNQLKDTLLGPLWMDMESMFAAGDGTIHLSTKEAELLNLPWELLPSSTSGFLVADGRWGIRRTTREALAPPALGQVALPLRILFAACAPIDQMGLDYEREEEAMLRLATKLGNRVHLSIAEAATFDELRNLISELKPHMVHLSGHGIVQEGIGYFTFEDERGRSDSRDARSMAEQLFAGRGVRAVFVSGCQSAQAAAAGVCQTLTATGHVPVALGWGASVADGLATDFAGVFYHELAAGRSLDASVATARREMYANGQFTEDGSVHFDASFALPQLFAADATNDFVNQSLPLERVHFAGVRYELLGDRIVGLREGFVGRRRLLQRLRPGLRDGDFHVLLLTGMGGAGKSTLATRLANRCLQEGYQLAALKAGRSEGQTFALRLVQEIGIACQRLGRDRDDAMLSDGNRPLPTRLRLAVEILKEAKILLVLDNLEDLMPLPPSAPRWVSEELAGFFQELFSRLTGAGRCIMTCRYVPEGFDATQPGLAHEPIPDFSEAEFIKCLSRNERVVERMASGEITRELLSLLHRKIGGTPRFVKLATDVLAAADTAKLERQLESAVESDGDDALNELREKYLNDIFLPELYLALEPPHRLALSRLALVEPPLPFDGVAQIAGLTEPEGAAATIAMLSRGMLQKLGEDHETALYAVYPLQRDFLTQPDRLAADVAAEAHCAAAAFFESCYKSDRESELRLSFMAELFACREHAVKGGDSGRVEWATLTFCRYLYRNSEFRKAVSLLEPLAQKKASPNILKLLADCLQRLSEWSRAKIHYLQAVAGFESTGDLAAEAATWVNLANIDLSEGSYAAAQEKFERALEMSRAIGNPAGEAATWACLASIDLNEGNLEAARDKFERALEMFQADGDRAGEAAVSHQLAVLHIEEGNHVVARESLELGLKINQSAGNRTGEAATWHCLASIDLKEVNYAAARKKFERALEMLQAIGDRAGEAATRHQLACIDFDEGNHAGARENLEQALKIEQSIGNRTGEAGTLAQIGIVAWRNERREVGVKLQGIAYELLHAIGASEQKVTWDNLTGMASDLGFDKEEFDAMMQDAATQYQHDRAQGLVEKAFEGL